MEHHGKVKYYFNSSNKNSL